MHSAIQRVKSQISIVDVAGLLGMGLDTRGTHPTADCPFCSDKKMHLNLYPVTSTFHCFKCQKHGDLIDLIAEIRGISIKEALQILNQRFLYTVPTPPEKPQKDLKMELTGQIPEPSLTAAQLTDIFHSLYHLCGLTDRGRDYMHARGFSDTLLEIYDVVSIDDPPAVSRALLHKFALDELRAAGLFDNSRNGKPYFVFFHPAILFFHFDLESTNIVSVSSRNLAGEVKCFKLHNRRSRLFFGNDVVNSPEIYVFEGIITALSSGELLGKHNFIALGGLITPRIYASLQSQFKGQKIILGIDPDTPGNQALAKLPQHTCIDWHRLLEKFGLPGEIPVTPESKPWDLNDILIHVRKLQKQESQWL